MFPVQVETIHLGATTSLVIRDQVFEASQTDGHWQDACPKLTPSRERI